ncbi:hypothetical protein F5I97DRAFT_2042628 [Phlebopus sp. FC_14]|nr:hypothetical protein F5I97DRAFT_2042628 [Phlebopus sp. FC_14]
MSAQLLRHSTARRLLCFSCPQSRHAKAYSAQVALASSSSACSQNSESSTSTVDGDFSPERGDANGTSATTHLGQPQGSTSRSPLEPTRVDRYLASIRAAGLEPTLEDVERCRPERHSRPDSSRYAEEYNDLVDTLCRSFSKGQLRRFTELYKLGPMWSRSSRRKAEYAESIIERQWGWPSLKEIERKQKDRTEIVVKNFPVTPSQLFLILGKDGADLLQLSIQYNVHISLTSNPLALRVEGLRGALKTLTEHINVLKKDIIEEIFELPTSRPIRQDLVQRISRLAGAYVESHGNKGKIRICAKSINNMKAAERLALRASLEGGAEVRLSTVCYSPPGIKSDSSGPVVRPLSYSVYPFLTPNSFPWTMNAGGAFRIRRVADWLGINASEDITKTGGLVANEECLLSLSEAGLNLQELIFGVANPTNGRRSVTASLGHVLLSARDDFRRTNIQPPLKGRLSLSEILHWLKASETPLTFIPSLPPSVMVAPPNNRRAFHRLIYKTLPQPSGMESKLPEQVIKFELEFTDLLSGSPETPMAPVNADLPLLTAVDCRSQSSSEPSVLDNQGLQDVSVARCQIGEETFLNVMMPDRPMDMQFSVFDYEDVILDERQLSPLRQYADNLRAFASSGNKDQMSQPDPPSMFNHEGREYYLHDSWSLRQSNNLIPMAAVLNGYDREDYLVNVHSERILDLESSQRTDLCQLTHESSSSGCDWPHFLSACDQLSAVPFQPQNKGDVQVDNLEE